MENSERVILKTLREEAQDASSLFSNIGQELQERTVVAGLLRILGIDFRENEIIKHGSEPIDVRFRGARFQVTEILDEGRPRNLEIKQRAERVSRAKGLKDLLEPGTISSRVIASDELVAIVSARTQEKARKYGGKCRDVDLLIYVNLQGRHSPSGPFQAYAEEVFVGWRSVSVVMERFAIILWAAADAPPFLVQHKGRAVMWEKLDSVFPRFDEAAR